MDLRLACPDCGSRHTVAVRAQAGPHFARLTCSRCGRFLRPIPRPAPGTAAECQRSIDDVRKY